MADIPAKAGDRFPLQKWLQVWLIAASIVLISLAHYFTDTKFHLYHDVYRRLYYLPIFVAALWFGVRGGLGTSLACSILYAPHIIFQWKLGPTTGLERYLEIILFNIVGAITGLLAQGLNRQKNLYQRTSEELEQAYEKHESRSARLSSVERDLRKAEKLSALGELSATVAHELMNPLGSIKGAVEILRDDYPEDHKKHTFLKILIKEIDRLDRTIRSILRFSRREKIVRKRCHPNDIIETILTLTQGEARQRGIEVIVSLSDSVKPMQLDSDKINQVILNLIINAIQAMPDGGSLRVSTEWKKDLLDAGKDKNGDEYLSVTFEDSGVGIPKEKLEEIFDPFYSTKEEGTGHGLPLCKECAEFVEGGWLCHTCARKERHAVLVQFDPHYSELTAVGDSCTSLIEE